MRYYPVTELELDTLGDLSFWSEALFALAGASASIGVTLYFDSFLIAEASAAGTVLLEVGPWVCGILTFIFGALGVIHWVRRRSVINKIKEQSRPMSVTASRPHRVQDDR